MERKINTKRQTGEKKGFLRKYFGNKISNTLAAGATALSLNSAVAGMSGREDLVKTDSDKTIEKSVSSDTMEGKSLKELKEKYESLYSDALPSDDERLRLAAALSSQNNEHGFREAIKVLNEILDSYGVDKKENGIVFESNYAGKLVSADQLNKVNNLFIKLRNNSTGFLVEDMRSKDSKLERLVSEDVGETYLYIGNKKDDFLKNERLMLYAGEGDLKILFDINFNHYDNTVKININEGYKTKRTDSSYPRSFSYDRNVFEIILDKAWVPVKFSVYDSPGNKSILEGIKLVDTHPVNGWYVANLKKESDRVSSIIETTLATLNKIKVADMEENKNTFQNSTRNDALMSKIRDKIKLLETINIKKATDFDREFADAYTGSKNLNFLRLSEINKKLDLEIKNIKKSKIK